MASLLERIPSHWRTIFSPGLTILLCISLVTTALILLRPSDEHDGLTFWTFSRNHYNAYLPAVDDWNERHLEAQVDPILLDYNALQRRMLSGFLSGTPLADIIEVETGIAGRAFAGPVDAVGFVDLTDRLRDEGLLEMVNEPSFTPWTTRGRIFGLPHDVHPVLLGYRADITDAYGIDMTQIETWDDFERILGPLMEDQTGDGRIDRYLINYWYSDVGTTNALLMQGGGRLFNEQGQPTLNDPLNVQILSRFVLWSAGPRRIALDARNLTAAGNQLLIQGQVIATIVPDWMVGNWKLEMPQLAGKMRLMPLPAHEPGGLRTTVWGGTMIGIPKVTEDFEAAWQFAKELYLSEELAEGMYREMGIITPVREYWDLPFFDEPDPFFGGQPAGRIFIDAAPYVPRRVSSSYRPNAHSELTTAMLFTVQEVEERGLTGPSEVIPILQRHLDDGQARLERLMSRNVFLNEATEEGP